MDPQQFDRLSRLLARRSPPRRTVLAALVGLVLPFRHDVVPPVSAACKKVNQTCDRNRDCCDQAECRSGKCRCKSGFDECTGKCKNFDADEKHCGGCNNRCRGNERCCGGDCADLQTNNDHCDVCDRRCDESEECTGGNCLPPAAGCPAGFDGCAGGGQNFCGATNNCRCHQSTEGATVCIDPLTSVLTCGQCETSDDCNSGEVCVQTVPDGSCCTLAGGNFCAQTCAP